MSTSTESMNLPVHSSRDDSLPPNFTSPIDVGSASSRSSVRASHKGRLIGSKQQGERLSDVFSKPLTEPLAARQAKKTPSVKLAEARTQGTERFEYIEDPERRKGSQCDQIKQIKIDLARLLLTTGCHSCLLIVPPSWRVHKYATAGSFNEFLQMYVSTLQAQRKLKRRPTELRIDDVWERFHARDGIRHSELLCSVLHETGCDAALVEEFKDAYLAALASDDRERPLKPAVALLFNSALRQIISRSEGRASSEMSSEDDD